MTDKDIWYQCMLFLILVLGVYRFMCKDKVSLLTYVQRNCSMLLGDEIKEIKDKRQKCFAVAWKCWVPACVWLKKISESAYKRYIIQNSVKKTHFLLINLCYLVPVLRGVVNLFNRAWLKNINKSVKK